MNHDSARQRKSDQRWDYTTSNDGRGHAIGYCAGWREPVRDDYVRIFGESRADACIAEFEAVHRPHQAKYHADGHATAEEACECYKRYRLDCELTFLEDNPKASSQHRCKAAGCDVFTSGRAKVGAYNVWPLCAEHRTREVVALLFDVGESWHS